ncbi:P-II family nitrogen regulator [Mahella australiensis]|uniref:Nitrogen regulatory protein P-II n=1 Tax=Mahella australiensis (strain DSM 15567 / CIP 107919 / 50-1 BON) TaxID=697281 RepID=F3ZX14_MAHA5|nr:hypothetical protein [Mahella australiensis]AEE95463.1 hypothetical protein Mahau_0245 [Mahella australiensis 50-1 BON]
MYVLFIVLNNVDKLKKVLAALKDVGVRGATIIDSVGSGSMMKEEFSGMPIIGSLMRSLEGNYGANKTIFSVIEREEQVNDAMAAVSKVLGDMNRPDTGIMFALPVVKFKGGELERHIDRRERRNIIQKQYESEYY